ncbi:hypothetical protein K1W54_24555 [Micromonospora sp. CPCC 205371]|nr:hypothetical protein [Micromonospora sp. CPCC 205371]
MPTHAWFRVDEAHPIAEHAVACPQRRLTTAEVRAGAPQRPALVWQSTPAGDVLASNGAPAWYDQTGEEHTARAWTWQHTATGRRHSAAQPDYDTAYLPLDTDADRAPVIELLREARYTGRHWLALDLDPGQQHLITSDAVRLLDHRDQIAPPNARWVAATVSADAVGHGWYPALIADGYRIGPDDVIARFNRASVEQMVLDLIERHADDNPATDPMPGELAVLGFDADALVVSWERDDGSHTWLHEIDRVYPDEQGLYAVGAYLWPWQTVVKEAVSSQRPPLRRTAEVRRRRRQARISSDLRQARSGSRPNAATCGHPRRRLQPQRERIRVAYLPLPQRRNRTGRSAPPSLLLKGAVDHWPAFSPRFLPMISTRP